MNIRTELLQEHSKKQCLRIVDHIGTNEERFGELVDLFLTSDYRLNQRAAWPLCTCVIRHPTLVKPHLRRFILNLTNPKLHDAVVRNTFRFLQEVEIPKSLQGIAIEVCLKFLRDSKAPIAVKVFAMTVAANIAVGHRSLSSELVLVIEDQMPFSSAGFVSRGKKILRKLSLQTT